MNPFNGDEDWFARWFDSPYYPILYRHRDANDATQILSTVLPRLGLAPGAPVLDLACGDGRHSAQLAEHGFRVTGIDLSPHSIRRARNQYADADNAPRFAVGDMRSISYEAEFECVFNLFTSFGYFADWEDNLAVLYGIHRALRPGGWLVLDYLNAERVAATLVPEETKTEAGVTFHLTRQATESHILKHIQITDGPLSESFTERVQRISLAKFQEMLRQTGFTFQWALGDYAGREFEEGTSPRLILGAVKG